MRFLTLNKTSEPQRRGLLLSPFMLSLPSPWMVAAMTVTADEGRTLGMAEQEDGELVPSGPTLSLPTGLS